MRRGDGVRAPSAAHRLIQRDPRQKRAGLRLHQRQFRSKQAALRIDLVPRSCLILLLPLGLQLASNLQLIALPAGSMALIWAAGIAWLLLS